MFSISFAGVEGGFDSDQQQYEIEEINEVVVLPDWTQIPLTDPSLPPEVVITSQFTTLAIILNS